MDTENNLDTNSFGKAIRYYCYYNEHPLFSIVCHHNNILFILLDWFGRYKRSLL